MDSLNSVCKKCPLNCDNCNLDNTCNNCSDKFFLKKLDKKCYSKCDTGFYPDITKRECIECKSPCLECVDSTKCLSCIDNFFLSKTSNINNCLTDCPLGYYGKLISKTCEECDKKCKLCKNSDINCLSCKDEFYFQSENFLCFSTCPKGYFNSKNDNLRICKKCKEECSLCSELEDNCLDCKEGFYLLKDKCLDKSPDGFYIDKNVKKILICDKSCITCKGPLNKDCISCDDNKGLIYNKGYCINDSCPEGLIKIENNVCLDLKTCINSMILSLDNIFNIELTPMIINLIYSLKSECIKLNTDIKIKWDYSTSFYDKSKITNFDKTFTVESEYLNEGIMYVKVDLIYKNLILGNIEKQSLLVFNKVTKFF